MMLRQGYESTAADPAEPYMRRALLRFEGGLNKIFGNDLNPMYHLGALGFYFFWIIAVSGAYLYGFYRTGAGPCYPFLL